MEEAAQIAIKADPLAVLSFIFHLALILVFMVPYVSAQFNPGGKTFSTSFGMSETSGILLTAFAVTIV